jgi:spore germination protein KC
MNRKHIFLYLMLVSTLLISGCWGKKELTDLAIVSAVGIDKNEEDNFVGTFQIISPGNVAGGLQGGGGGNSPPVTASTSTGDTIFETARRASKETSRIMYYAHANLFVISEKLAKEEGLIHIFDSLERDPQFRTTTKVVIAHGSTAEDIVKTITPVDKIPANKVINTLEFTSKILGETIDINIQDVIKNLSTPGKEPVITGFRLKGNPEEAKKLSNVKGIVPVGSLVADGLAVFKDGKLIDWLEYEKARGVVWILNKIKQTEVDIDWEQKKDAFAYGVSRQQTKVTTTLEKGEPIITVHVDVEGDIGEVSVPVNLNDPQVILNIEKEVEKEIKEEIKKAVQYSQKHQTDILGFGEVIHISEPEAWKKLQHEWNDVHFPELKVNVKVDAFIRRTGLRNNSYISDIK